MGTCEWLDWVRFTRSLRLTSEFFTDHEVSALKVLYVTSMSVMNFVGDDNVDDAQKTFYQQLSKTAQFFSAKGLVVKSLVVKGLGAKGLDAHGLVQKLLTIHA